MYLDSVVSVQSWNNSGAQLMGMTLLTACFLMCENSYLLCFILFHGCEQWEVSSRLVTPL